MTPTETLKRRLWKAFEELTTLPVGEPVLRVAVGYWAQIRQDVMRFQGVVEIGGVEYSIGSWDNIGTLVRQGFEIEDCRRDDRRYVDYEIHRKGKGA